MHLHYHAECRAEVQGKEGKYSVFMSRLSLHLLGSAGSCFCLIKGWLMNGATEGDGKIETKRKERGTLESLNLPAYTWICATSLSAFVWIRTWFCHLFCLTGAGAARHCIIQPHLFFSEKHQKNLELWGGLFNQWNMWMEELLLCIGAVVCIHSICFKPSTSKPSIHRETEADLRQLLEIFSFVFFIFFSTLINSTLVYHQCTSKRMWEEVHSKNNRNCVIPCICRSVLAERQGAILI